MASAPQPVPISSTCMPGADAGAVQHAVDLAELGVGQVVAGLEPGRRVRHRLVEELLEQLVGQVVVPGDVGPAVLSGCSPRAPAAVRSTTCRSRCSAGGPGWTSGWRTGPAGRRGRCRGRSSSRRPCRPRRSRSWRRRRAGGRSWPAGRAASPGRPRRRHRARGRRGRRRGPAAARPPGGRASSAMRARTGARGGVASPGQCASSGRGTGKRVRSAARGRWTVVTSGSRSCGDGARRAVGATTA